MAVKFANNVSTTLSAAINATQTTISVADASGLPTLSSGDYVYLTIDTDTDSPTREVVKVTAVSSNDLTVVRGQDDTTASSFSSGTKVELRVTAASLSDISSAADTESVSIAGDTMTGNLTVPSLNSGGITTSSHIDFTATTSLLRNQQDNSGQIGIQVKNSGGTIREVRWDAANNTNGAWRPTSNGGADLGITNKIWNNLFVNTIKMGTGNVEVIDSARNGSFADVSAVSFLSDAGSAASPAYQVGDTDSGFYDSGANEVGVSLAGVLEYEFKQAELNLYSNNLVTTGYVKTGAGSAASPALQVGDDNSGFYDSGANEVGVTLDGVLEYEFTPTQFDMASNNLVTSGTISSGPIVATGTGTTNTTNALRVARGNNASAFTVRDDGVVLVQQNYLYVNNTAGMYSLGAFRARGGITNDGGNPLSIDSGASHINFNNKNLESVGNVQATRYRIGTTDVIDSSRNLQNVTLSYGNSGARFQADGWHRDNGSQRRFYFQSNGNTYFGTGAHYVFRSSADSGVATLSNVGGLNLKSSGDTLIGSTVALAVGGVSVIDSSRRFGANVAPNASYAINALQNGSLTRAAYFQANGGSGTGLEINATAGTYSGDALYVRQSTVSSGGNLARFANSSGDKFTVTTAGNVGIDTSSIGSSTKLQVAGRGLFTDGLPDPGDGSPAGVAIGYTSGYGFIQAIQTGVANKPLRIQPNGTDHIILGAGGAFVGIGTIAPNAVLETVSPTSGGAPVFRTGTADFLGVQIGTTGGGFSLESNNYFAIWHQPYANKGTQTNLTERFHISSGGNVGINTGGSTPEETLSVMGGFQVALNTSVTGRGLKVSTSNNQITDDLVTLNAQAVTGVLRFDTAGNEAGRFDASQNFLIGTQTSAVQNFSSGSGSQISDGYIAIARGGAVALLNRISTDGDIIEFKKNGSTVGSVATTSSRLSIGSNDVGLFFDSTNDRFTPIHQTNQADRNGAIDLGYTSSRFKDLYLSNTAYANQTILSSGNVKSDNVFQFLTTGNAAQNIRTRSVFAGTSYSDVPPAGSFNATNTYELNGTTVIDSSRNLSNISSITAAGVLQVTNNSGSNGTTTSQYAVIGIASGGAQATIGSQHNGDGYANLNLGSIVSGDRKMWHISKRLSSLDNRLEFFWYESGGFNSRFTFATDGKFTAHNDIQANQAVNAVSGFRVNGTTVIDNGRNLLSIGSISASTLTTSGKITVTGNEVLMNGSNERVKYAVWSNTTYGIGMTSGVSFGGIGGGSSDYAMTFQMNTTATRGFVWLDSDDTLAQGAMALTTDGKLSVANAVRIGFGKTDTTTPNSSTAMVNVNGDVMSTGAKIAHSEHQGVLITGTDSNSNSAFTSMRIDHNASGSTALTADRSHIALAIDMDSNATGGNTTDEHRLYGIHNSVKATGDSDLIYGIYSIAEAEQTAGQVSNLYGIFGQATTDAVAGQISNSYGVYGFNSLTASSGTTINNGYALYGKALVGASQDSNISAVHGLYAEVEIDASGAGTTVSTVYGVRSEIDNDAGSADTTISNGYLFYGNYAGDLPTAVYGVYIADAVRNYFAGNITTGDGSTGTAAYGFNGDTNTGMYSPANHQLGFIVNGTQRLLLTSAGATITGDATLGSATTNARLFIRKPDDNLPNHINIFCGSTQTGEIGSMDTTWLRINQNVAKNIYTPRYIRADNGFFVDGNSMGIDGSGRLRAFAGSNSSVGIGFDGDANLGFTRPTSDVIGVVAAGGERARINSDGIELRSGKLLKCSRSDNTRDIRLFCDNSFGTLETTTDPLRIKSANSIRFDCGGNDHRMNLDTSGNLVVQGNVTAFGSPSDIRLKENIERIADPVEKVKKLDGVTFQYKKTGAKSTGLIAQQLLEVLPEVVYEETDLESGERHYAVRYGQVVGLLVEAMKEQQDQIDSLKSIIEEMSNGNN